MLRRYETSGGPIEIRELQTIADMVAAEQIQLAVWGRDIYPHPKEILIPIQHEGGLLAGAFDAQAWMVGLVLQFPTRDPSAAHSQILAVEEAWRGMGVGRWLKWFQRDWSLERGITCLRWTVDPLRAANAELNIRRLGAVSSIYYPDYYGPMQGIDAGAPTDRLLVEWRLDSARVSGLANDTPPDSGFPGAPELVAVRGGRPVRRAVELDGSPVLLRIPDDFIRLSKVDPGLALEWRMLTRAAFVEAFAKGYTIFGFTRSGGPAYCLEKEKA